MGSAWTISVAVLLPVVLVTAVIWRNIFGKAGYPGWYAVLMFVPIANLAALFLLAFADWPIHRELRRLRTYSHTPTRHQFDLTR